MEMQFLRRVAGNARNAFRFTSTGLSLKEKWRLALPGPILSVGGVLIHNVFIKYYTDIIGLSPTMVGWVYIIYNIWNAINDPFIGVWIDKMRHKPRRGKYVYVMRVTVPFMILSSFAMMLSSPSWNEWTIFLLYTVELFIYDTAATAYSIAYQSYTLVAAPTKEERVDVNIIQNYVSQGMSFLVTMIPTMLLVGDGKREVILPIFTLVILAESIFFTLALRGLRDDAKMYESLENQHLDLRDIWKESWQIIKSRPFLSYILFSIITVGPIGFYFTPFLYYMDDVMNVSGATATIVDVSTHVAVLLVLPVAGYFIKKNGTKISVYWGTLTALLGYLGIFLAPNLWIAAISYTLVVFTVNYIRTAAAPMGALIIDENERTTGVRKTGLFNGLFSVFTVAFSSIQTVVFINVIGSYGYDGTADFQTDSALFGIRLAAGIIPLAAVLLGLLPISFYPFDKKKEEEISAFSNRARRGEGA
ncbi:MFS transporter [Cohnella phaseoli]|uniref:GPH family glycoside/pentoside/hexuronide:cation symporter n=2 Tax=Cohnella TaxID=329857 RepID=A0A3D9IJS5_9BACL|nr:MFS transporter [Cohnella phaseoli]RED61965.1 GPH family glycoside/pentoside/hexuronide:cation symporter [Cohnella phaseoli]